MLSLADLVALANEAPDALNAPVAEFSVGRRALHFNTAPAIMGVINLSADSWYRESVCLNETMALRRLDLLLAQGADLIDLGAESTLPDASRATGRRQLDRLVPILREAVRRGAVLSVETYLPSVARRCLEEGAAVINLTRGAANQGLYRLIAEHNAAVILCHVQGRNVRAVDKLEFAGDPVAMMYDYFGREIERATRAGVAKLFVDPGLGFYYSNLQDGAERVRHQIRMFLRSHQFRRLGFPVCQALPHAFEFFAEDVRCAEPFFAVLAALGRTDLFRTHEVSRVRAVLESLSTV